MKRTVGVMTVAVMLCAQTGAYAADQMSKEGESSKQSGQSGQDRGQAGQDMQRQVWTDQPASGQSGKAGQDSTAAAIRAVRELQRGNAASKRANLAVRQAGAGSVPETGAGQAGVRSTRSGQAGLVSTSSGRPRSTQAAGPGFEGSKPAHAGTEQAARLRLGDQDKQSAQDQGRASGATQTINGQFVRMENDFYIIKDQSGKETCIPTSYGTFVDQTFSPGDTIAARLGQDGTALVIGRPSDRQPTSSRADFAASQQGSQSPDSGARDQSMKSADKGVSGSQQAASVLKGELLKIQGEFYTVKDQSGSEVRLHVNKETKMESAVSVGDKIEAERTTSDHAISIKKAQDTGGSRNR